MKIKSCFLFVLSLIFPVTCVFSQAADEEVMLAFRHPAIGGYYIPCLLNDQANQVYLPVIELFNIFQINYEPDIKNFTIRGNYLKPNNPYVINLNLLQIQLGREVFPITPEDFKIGATDYYLSPALFEKVFGLSFTANINYLTLTLVTGNKLPVQEKRERAEQRSKMSENQVDTKDFPLAYKRSRKILGGAMVDYALNGMYTSQSQNLSYRWTGGMEVIGGDIQGTVTGTKSANTPNYLQSSGLRWRFVVRENPFFATFTAGQLSTSGINSKQIRGISITNDPVQPRKSYDNYLFDGHTEPESEVELYMNGKLIGYMRADELGYYRFNVPISYGVSHLSTRVYTPSGEVKLIDRELQVPFTFLPKGVVDYHLQGGTIENSMSDISTDKYAGHGDVAVGITKWLTGSIGTDYTTPKLWKRTPLWYGSLSGRIAKQYLVSTDIAPANYYRFSGSVMYHSDLNLNFAYAHYPHIGIFNTLGAIDDFTGSAYLPVKILGISSGVRLSVQETQLSGRTSTKINLDLSSRFRQFNLRANYKYSMAHIHDVAILTDHSLTASLTYTIARTPGIPVYIRGMFIRAQDVYDFRYQKLTQTDIQLSRTLFSHARVNLSFAYNFMQKQIATEIGLTIDLKSIRSNTLFNSTGKSVSLRQNLSGSLGVDSRQGKIELSNREQAGSAAISVISYVDVNNSGKFDKGDEILPYNSVILDNPTTSEVCKDGVLRISQMQSYYRYNLKVNRAAISDPTLVPLTNEFSFITDPNQFKRIEIPFYRGGVIDGMVSVQRGTGLQGQGGLRLLIKGVGSQYEQTVRTFADGGFYAMDIPPGKYTLEVDEAQLGFLGVQKPVPLKFEIQALATGDYIEGQKIILIPLPDKTEEK